MESLLNKVHHMDFFELCRQIPDGAVDMIFADLPYQITNAKWDILIPIDQMWEAFKRVIKPNGAIVLTANQPFTSMLVMSNLKMYKEEIIWNRVTKTGFLNANKKHMRQHETILIFYKRSPVYNPQMIKGKPYRYNSIKGRKAEIYNGYDKVVTDNETGNRYPSSILTITTENRYKRVHPTQKPVPLVEYFINTYTNQGEVVLDPCAGSGTTAIACRNTGRSFICGDNDLGYVTIANNRLNEPYNMTMF